MDGIDNPQTPDVLKELYRDLAAKYKKHEATIEQYWMSFDQAQRTECIKAGAYEGIVLRHSRDKSMGNVYMIFLSSTSTTSQDQAQTISWIICDIVLRRVSWINMLMDRTMVWATTF